MDKLKRILLIFMIFTGMNSAFAHADVIVSIPNSQAPFGGILTLPVEIRNIESPGMIAYQFTISFDENVLRFRDVLKTGTVTETWTDPVTHQQHNHIVTIGGYNAIPVTGDGILVKVRLDVVGSMYDLSYISFEKFIFNDGSEFVQSFGGDVVVVQAEAAAITDLRIKAVNLNSVQLNWSETENASFYHIYRDTVPFFTPGTPIATVSDTEYIDIGYTGNPVTNYFYVVKAGNTVGESAISNRVGEFDYQLVTTATTDFNEIALPLEMPHIVKASDLMAAIPHCNSVAQWNAFYQGYEQYIELIPPTDFDVLSGYPYYVNVTSQSVFTLTGSYSQPRYNLITTTTTDFNEIMIPLGKNGLSLASDLLASIPHCNSVARWNAQYQGYEQYIELIPPTNFNVRIGYPYYVNVTSNGTWPAASKKSSPHRTEAFGEKHFNGHSHIPHLVYGRIKGNEAYRNTKFEAVSGRNDILTHRDPGCGVSNGFFWIQCGQFEEQWKKGDRIRVLVKVNKLCMEYEAVLTHNAYDVASLLTLDKDDVDDISMLHQNYPNPFNASTLISFFLKQGGDVSLAIYNTVGQRVKVLVEERMVSGKYSVMWNGTNESGAVVSSGIYWSILRINDKREIKKMIYMR